MSSRMIIIFQLIISYTYDALRHYNITLSNEADAIII